MFWNAFMKLIWFIFVQGPLNLIAAFTKVLEYLTGGIINDILFGSEKDFTWKKIPVQFWWFVVIASCIFSLVFTIQMIILIFKEAAETKVKFIVAIQNGVKAFIFIFLIPIFFFLANFIIQSLANTIINNFGNNSNIAQYLWHIGDPTWDGSANGVPENFGCPNNIGQYNILAQLFGIWFMLFAIFMIGAILVQRIIELFFLFIISPIVMIVMVVDDGKAAFTWKDMVGAKFLASTVTLIGYYIFISVTQILLSSKLEGLQANDFSKSLFIILFLCGGGLATLSFSEMIAHFVGESIGIKEGMSSFRTTVAGGMMAMGATKIASKALRFRRSRRDSTASTSHSNYNDGLSTLNSAFSDDGSTSDHELNFSTFYSANTGLSSRSGIVGLAGLALAASGIGISKFKANKKVTKNIDETVVKPVKKNGSALNPRLSKFYRTRTTVERQNLLKKAIEKNQRRIGLQKQKLVKKNNNFKATKKINKKINKLENFHNLLEQQKTGD